MVFYRNWFKGIDQIPSTDMKYDIIKMIFNYGFDGITPPAELMTNPYDIRVGIFNQAKELIDHDRSRWQKCVENGKKGGAPKGNKNAKNSGNALKGNQNARKHPKTDEDDDVPF